MKRLFDADSRSGYPSVGVLAALAQQHRALRRRLAEVEAGVEHDLLGREPGRLGRPRRRSSRNAVTSPTRSS